MPVCTRACVVVVVRACRLVMPPFNPLFQSDFEKFAGNSSSFSHVQSLKEQLKKQPAQLVRFFPFERIFHHTFSFRPFDSIASSACIFDLPSGKQN